MKTTASRRLGAFAGLAAAAALTLTACSVSTAGSPSDDTDDGAASQELTYQIGWLPTVEWGANWIADAEGYYEDEGIAFEWLPGGPNVSPDTVVTAGTATVGNASAEVVASAINAGAPLKIIGAAFQQSPFSIVSLADSPIETPEDMIGKRIGVAASNQTQFETFLQINGIDPSALEIVPVQFDPSPVANGEVDGQVVYSINEPAQLNVQGIDTYTMLFADYGFEVLTDTIFATEETIANEPELLASFLRASQRGYLDMFEDPAAAADLAVNEYGSDQGLSVDHQTLEVEAMAELVMPEGQEAPLLMSDERMAGTVETLGLGGIEISVDELFDTSVQDLLR
ncbi:ABC transporter substrate-binding protein [Microbacterium betulae]|uniref:Thiamine pyrimidine synthase n=1 Tax=Microbacterium betulae TaxID=2981139 RepID=A0AA97I6U0_9MICO|nr:ABC transporter substrate-binding protein [Microbacterium sp. AB]WOF22982.1 ABC transporter substrate-binding protein [Microbacterium sp. AB]